jgi:hypothetical protein
MAGTGAGISPAGDNDALKILVYLQLTEVMPTRLGKDHLL